MSAAGVPPRGRRASRRAARRLHRTEKMAHFITEECVLCTLCEAACPEGAVRRAGGRCAIEPAACTDCGACVEVCPQECILAPDALSPRPAAPP